MEGGRGEAAEEPAADEHRPRVRTELAQDIAEAIAAGYDVALGLGCVGPLWLGQYPLARGRRPV